MQRNHTMFNAVLQSAKIVLYEQFLSCKQEKKLEFNNQEIPYFQQTLSI